jgi:hypothetical protein
VRYIEGNTERPLNPGTICAKGAPGVMIVTAFTLIQPVDRVATNGVA